MGGDGYCVHQSMWKADFGAVDSTIAGRFNDGKERRQVRIEYYAVDDVLERI